MSSKEVYNKLNSDPILSICIPTYNRPNQFQRLVSCLLLQGNKDKIEIVIRDDSSNEETLNIVRERLLPTEIVVRYYSGSRIGLDAANVFLIEKARGRFIWWFGDDDEMRPGAVVRVLNLIESDPCLRYIWANFDYDIQGNSVVNTASRYFTSGDDIITKLGVNIGLLSTHIFHRQTALESLELAKKNCIGFGFAGLIPIFHIINNSGRYYLLGEPYILCNPTKTEEIALLVNKNGFIDNTGFDVYGVNFYEIVKLFDGKFSRKASRKLLANNYASLWRGMIVGWVGGWDTPQGKRIRMLKIYWSFPEFWIAIPLFLLPRTAVSFLYHGYKYLFKRRKLI